MSFNDRWARLVQSKPALAKEDSILEINVANLKVMLKAFYGMGTKDQAAVIETLKSSKNTRSVDELMSQFDSLFGKRGI